MIVAMDSSTSFLSFSDNLGVSGVSGVSGENIYAASLSMVSFNGQLLPKTTIPELPFVARFSQPTVGFSSDLLRFINCKPVITASNSAHHNGTTFDVQMLLIPSSPGLVEVELIGFPPFTPTLALSGPFAGHNVLSTPYQAVFDPCSECAPIAQAGCEKLVEPAAAENATRISTEIYGTNESSPSMLQSIWHPDRVCRCPEGYVGDGRTCMVCPGGPFVQDLDTFSNCTGHGECSQAQELSSALCFCRSPWLGEDCAVNSNIAAPQDLSLSVELNFQTLRMRWQPISFQNPKVQLLSYAVRFGLAKSSFASMQRLRVPANATTFELRELQVGAAYQVFLSSETTVGESVRAFQTATLRPNISNVSVLSFTGYTAGSTYGGDVVQLVGKDFKLDDEITTIFYGSVSDSRQFTCAPVFVNRTHIRCTTAAGVGSKFHFSVSTQGVVSAASIFEYNYLPPMVNNFSLIVLGRDDQSINGTTGAGILPGNELLRIDGANFGTNPQFIFVKLGDFPCRVQEVNQTTLVCSTSFGMGSELQLDFSVGVSKNLAQLAVPSANFFSYPKTPLINDVTGCSDPQKSTKGVTCPTEGGRITVIGENFGTIEGALAVLVFDKICTGIELMSKSELSCDLPAGTGNNLPISVIVAALTSPQATLVNYAAPIVTAISSTGCAYTDSFGRAVGCIIGQNVTITGHNFGAHSAGVYIGWSECLNVVHDRTSPHRQLVVTLPPARDWKTVLVYQRFGTVSRQAGRLSYKTCGNGTEPTPEFTCVDCSPGFYSVGDNRPCMRCEPGSYNNWPGASVCLACPPGYFASDFSSTNCTLCPPGLHNPAHKATKCMSCNPTDFFYAYQHTECLVCPKGSICQDGIVKSKYGYWNLDVGTQVMSYRCPESFCDAGKCDAFRGDVMCGECEEGFYRSGQKCELCTRGSEWIGVMLFANLIPVAIVIYAEVNVLKPGQAIKVLTYYIQCMVIIFDAADFPILLDIAGFLTMSSKTDVSRVAEETDCYQASPIFLLWVELLKPLVSMIQLLLIVLCAFGVHLFKTRTRFGFPLTQWITSWYGLFLASYFPTINVIFSILVCNFVGTESRVKVEPSILCTSDEYLQIRMAAIAGFSFFVFMQLKVMYTLCRRTRTIEPQAIKDYIFWRALQILLAKVDLVAQSKVAMTKAQTIGKVAKKNVKNLKENKFAKELDFEAEKQASDKTELGLQAPDPNDFFQRNEKFLRKLALHPKISILKKNQRELTQFQNIFLDFRPGAGYYELLRLIWKSAFACVFTFFDGRDQRLAYVLLAVGQLLLTVVLKPYDYAKPVVMDSFVIKWVNRSNEVEVCAYAMLVLTIVLSAGMDSWPQLTYLVVTLHTLTIAALVALIAVLNIKLALNKEGVLGLEEVVGVLEAREKQDSREHDPMLVEVDELLTDLERLTSGGTATVVTSKKKIGSKKLASKTSADDKDVHNVDVIQGIVKVLQKLFVTVTTDSGPVKAKRKLSVIENLLRRFSLLPQSPPKSSTHSSKAISRKLKSRSGRGKSFRKGFSSKSNQTNQTAQIGAPNSISRHQFQWLVSKTISKSVDVESVESEFLDFPTFVQEFCSRLPGMEIDLVAVVSVVGRANNLAATKETADTGKGLDLDLEQLALGVTIMDSDFGLNDHHNFNTEPKVVETRQSRKSKKTSSENSPGEHETVTWFSPDHTLDHSKFDAEAIALVLNNANCGIAVAQANAGWLYEHGYGVPASLVEAKVWYLAAARNGNAFAQYNFGKVLYLLNPYDVKTLELSKKWVEAALESGYTKARKSLSQLTAALETRKSQEEAWVQIRPEAEAPNSAPSRLKKGLLNSEIILQVEDTNDLEQSFGNSPLQSSPKPLRFKSYTLSNLSTDRLPPTTSSQLPPRKFKSTRSILTTTDTAIDKSPKSKQRKLPKKSTILKPSSTHSPAPKLTGTQLAETNEVFSWQNKSASLKSRNLKSAGLKRAGTGLSQASKSAKLKSPNLKSAGLKRAGTGLLQASPKVDLIHMQDTNYNGSNVGSADVLISPKLSPRSKSLRKFKSNTLVRASTGLLQDSGKVGDIKSPRLKRKKRLNFSTQSLSTGTSLPLTPLNRATTGLLDSKKPTLVQFQTGDSNHPNSKPLNRATTGLLQGSHAIRKSN